MTNNCQSTIESLPVELWRELFEYFNGIQLWYLFRSLNIKIDTIIDQTMLHLNFQKKYRYAYFLRKIFPTINIVNVRSLKFNQTNEVHHFFSIYSLSSLIHLRLLSLDYADSFDNDSFTFWKQLSSLKYLRSLKIKFWKDFEKGNCVDEKKFIIRSIFNNDCCPLLELFIISTGCRHQEEHEVPLLIATTKPASIKYLSIDTLTFNDLLKLLPALQNVRLFHIDYTLDYDRYSNEPRLPIPTTTKSPLLSKCVKIYFKLSDDITFEHVEYILKQTPNIKDLFLWGWYHLLDAKKWELLLLTLCPKLIKLELVCTGPVCSDDFEQKIDVFEQECQQIPFWLQRNVIIDNEQEYSAHDYRSDIATRFDTTNLSCIQILANTKLRFIYRKKLSLDFVCSVLYKYIEIKQHMQLPY